MKPWEEAYASFWSNFDTCFKSAPTRNRAQEYVRGLLGGVERKNGWQLAEFIGDSAPYGIQSLLYRLKWDVCQTRDKIILAAVEYLLQPNERGVLIIDETGFLKKGEHSAGVQRQYSGTAGRIENSQIGVFLALASGRGRTLIDTELYLPKEWCENFERRKAAHIPEDIQFKTKPEMAQTMLERAFSLGIRPEWVLADSVYGNDGKLRQFLWQHKQPYVMAVCSNKKIFCDCEHIRIDEYIKRFDEKEWRLISCGNGAKGPRMYSWLMTSLGTWNENGLKRYLLCRRKINNGEIEYSYFYCLASENVTLEDLAMASGKRWNIECCFETAKQEVGLDEYEVRSWHGWYRHMTLCMIGLLLLNIFKSLGAPDSREKKGSFDKFKRERMSQTSQ